MKMQARKCLLSYPKLPFLRRQNNTLDCTYLILDLDDTVYPISTFPKAVAEPFFEAIATTNDVLSAQKLEKALEDSWFIPFYELSEKYQFSDAMVNAALASLDNLPALAIRPFQDYELVRQLDIPKYLVTSGMSTLQRKKIDALGVREDFDDVLINDPFQGVRGGKKALFEQLLQSYQLDPGEGLVIGDNIESELAAGEALGIRTVLIDRVHRYEQVPAWIDFEFDSFEEVLEMIS